LLRLFSGRQQASNRLLRVALTDRLELLDMMKKIPLPKRVVSIFQGSRLNNQTRWLMEFPFDCEVCASVSYRIRPRWNPMPELGGEFANAEAH
jgi:hypothetical protein